MQTLLKKATLKVDPYVPLPVSPSDGDVLEYVGGVWTNGPATVDSAEVSSISQGVVNSHADRSTGTAPGTTGAAHNARTGVSNILIYETNGGTGATLIAATESSTRTGVSVGDLILRLPDGTAGAVT